jgi:FKBP-type peptidyl-prolyl cis-trans isomerase SlyD
MKAGDSFDFVVESDEAYGEIEKEAIVKIPVDTFKVDGKFDAAGFPIGKLVPMSDQDGNMLRGKVLEVTADAIKMDFNHPLAGMDLYFTGQVINIREASQDEISHGHVHGPDGHHH